MLVRATSSAMLVASSAMLVALSAALVTPNRPLSRRELVKQASHVSLAAAVLPAAPLTATAAAAAATYQKQPGFKLNTGINFPTASFGLQVYDDDTARKLTTVALEAGYRNFFASVLAKNQKGFAQAVRDSGIPREELFICGSVLSNRAQGFDAAKTASARGCSENMEAFAVGGIDYLDMIMLDYPGPDEASIQGQWEALEEMQAAKLTRSLAVSNYSPRQLDATLANKGTVPTVNQLPYGVGFGSYYEARGGTAALIEANTKRGVLVQAWSPLGRALTGDARQACAEIGAKYGKSAAQVGLRWIADTGVTFTTQTKKRSHFEEDINIFDFQLTPEEVKRLASL